MNNSSGENAAFSYTDALSKVAWGGTFLLIGMALSKLFGFIKQLIIIRGLSPEEYGLITLGLSILIVSANIGNLGLFQSAQRYIAYYSSQNDRAKVKGSIYSSLRIATISGIAIMGGVLLCSQPLSSLFSKPELENILWLFAPIIPIYLLSILFTSFFLGLHRPDVYVWISDIFFGITSIGLILLFLAIKHSLYSPVWALSISFLLCFVLFLFAFIKIVSPKLRGVDMKPMGKELLRFGMPLFLNSILALIMSNIDTLMIGYFLPSEDVGFYNSAFLLMQFIPIFLFSFSIVYMPIATNLLASGNIDQINNLYQSVTKWLFVLTLPLFLTFSFFSRNILTLFYGSQYSAAGLALLILSAAEFVHTFLGPNDYSLIALGKTKIIFLGSLLAVIINIVLNSLLIPRIGINGAALATGLSLVVVNLVNSLYLYLKYRIHPFSKKYLVPVIALGFISLLLFFPLKYLVDYSSWFVLVCYPFFLIIGVFIIFLTKSVSDDDRLIWRVITTRFFPRKSTR